MLCAPSYECLIRSGIRCSEIWNFTWEEREAESKVTAIRGRITRAKILGVELKYSGSAGAVAGDGNHDARSDRTKEVAIMREVREMEKLRVWRVRIEPCT
jgi:hypothetical protein